MRRQYVSQEPILNPMGGLPKGMDVRYRVEPIVSAVMIVPDPPATASEVDREQAQRIFQHELDHVEAEQLAARALTPRGPLGDDEIRQVASAVGTATSEAGRLLDADPREDPHVYKEHLSTSHGTLYWKPNVAWADDRPRGYVQPILAAGVQDR
jgi:hypothetical protein